VKAQRSVTMSTLKKLMMCGAALMLLSLTSAVLSAQDNMGMGDSKTMSVTGCVKQGTDAKGYYLMGQDGKMYELWGKGLGEHVGHTVTVTGTQAKLSPAQEEKKEATEKAEAGSNSYVDMKVASLKMVSSSCQ
jgi:hypothetical protein